MVDDSGDILEPPAASPRNFGRWVTVVQIGLLAVALALSAYVAIQAFKPRPVPDPSIGRSGGGGFGGRGMRMRGMPPVDRKIVKDFDRNGDERLDAAKRAAARASLRNEGNRGPGGFGRSGGRGGTETPEPGMRLRPSDVRSYPGAPVYDLRTLRTVFLTFENADWAEELAAFYRTDVEVHEIKTKDDAESWRGFVNLCKVLNETPPAKLQAALEPILDIDGALKFLALDVALVNSDGYWTRASDYNIYRDALGTFHILPYDFNEAFGGEGSGGRGFGRGGGIGGAELDPLVGLDDARKPLRSKLLAVPALRERYLAYVRDVAERWLDWRVVQPMVRQWQALIEPDVNVDTRKIYSTDAFYADVGDSAENGRPAPENTLRGFIARRRAFLLR